MTDVDLAYAAGFFDGEGSIGVYRANQTQVQISNTCRESLENFARMFGGKVIKVPGKHMEDKNPKWRPAYAWRVYGLRAGECLALLLPYLKEKRPQAELFLQFLFLTTEEKKASDIPQQLKILKRLV